MSLLSQNAVKDPTTYDALAKVGVAGWGAGGGTPIFFFSIRWDLHHLIPSF